VKNAGKLQDVNDRTNRRRLMKFSGVWGGVLWAAALVLLLAPLAVSYQSYRPAWDEMYFLHRAVCVNRAVYDLDLAALDRCFQAMSKSPLMAGLLVMYGSVAGAPEKLGLATATLSLLCFAQIMILIIVAGSLRLPRLLTLGAALAVAVAQPISVASAPFLVDGLLSLIVTVLLLMTVAEAEPDPADASRDSWILRGLIWGGLLGLGILCKITFLYFAGAAGFLGLALSLKRSGLRATGWKLLGMGLALLIPLFVFLRYLENYMAHASGAAFGNLSHFYDDGLDRWAFLAQAVPAIGMWYWILLAVLLGAALLYPGSRLRRSVAAGCVLILLVYLWVSAGSPNKDPRFFWPIWVALPFCLVAFGRTSEPARTVNSALTGSSVNLPVAWAGVLSVLLVLPSVLRFDLTDVKQADAVLGTLEAGQPLQVLLASDEPTFNIETMLLARELDYADHAALQISTVVYDVTREMTREQSLDSLVAADVVILRDPPKPGAPDWANQHQPFFAQNLRARCAVQNRIGETTYVFRDC
jgi:hypothetical protein